MIFPKANIVKSESKRRVMLSTSEGREYFGKSTFCPKRKSPQNATWLANELMYYAFAKKADIPVPHACVLECDGRLFFGSEKLKGRTSSKAAIAYLDEEANRSQLVRALLLDLALLNNDRTLDNLLIDECGLIWFIDHDKCLLGDGRNTIGDDYGDMGRIDPLRIDAKFIDYLGDYLAFNQGNAILVSERNWLLVAKEFSRLDLQTETLEVARASIPPEWLGEGHSKALNDFLPLWWGRLASFIFSENSQAVLRDSLLRRNKL